MQVNKINNFFNYKRTANLGFNSRVAYIYHGNASQDLKDKVDRFEERHDNAEFIGAGLFAKVYLINGTNIVIKESLPSLIAKAANGNFSKEAEALDSLPKSLRNSQRLIANLVTEKGNSYLLSTLVQGGKPKVPTNLWERNHFASLFRNLFELDKNGIMHGDLNKGNCLITDDGNVNLIDYQYSDSFKISDALNNDIKYKNAPFAAPSNAQMFEMANLAYYLINLKDRGKKSSIKDTFISYLKEKSVYCKNRANYLRYINADNDMVQYERLQAKFLNNPSEDMIKLQALKLQVLYSFRQVFSVTDKNNESPKNIINTVPLYLYAAISAKKLLDFTDKLNNKTSDYDLQKYLSYEKKFGTYWRDKMVNEISGLSISHDGEYGAFKWILRNAMLNPHWKNGAVDPDDDLSEKFKQSVHMEFGNIEDISELITGKTDVKSKSNNVYGISDLKSNFIKIDNLIKQSEYGINDSELQGYSREYQHIMHIKELKENFIDSYNKAFHALDNQRYLAVLPSTIKALYNATLMQKASKNLYSQTYHTEVERFAQKNNILGEEAKELLSDIAKSLYRKILVGINNPVDDFSDALYYEKINEFDVTNCPNYDINKSMKFEKI